MRGFVLCIRLLTCACVRFWSHLSLPEIIWEVDVKRGVIAVDCAACGNHTQLKDNHKLFSYIIKHPPAPKGGKAATPKGKDSYVCHATHIGASFVAHPASLTSVLLRTYSLCLIITIRVLLSAVAKRRRKKSPRPTPPLLLHPTMRMAMSLHLVTLRLGTRPTLPRRDRRP